MESHFETFVAGILRTLGIRMSVDGLDEFRLTRKSLKVPQRHQFSPVPKIRIW